MAQAAHAGVANGLEVATPAFTFNLPEAAMSKRPWRPPAENVS